MAAHFDPPTRKAHRTFELYRHWPCPTPCCGEGRTEGGDRRRRRATQRGEEEEEEQTVIKLFVTGLESLEDSRARASAAPGPAAQGQYPDRLLPLLRLYHGPLPVQMEFQGQDGLVARIKAGPNGPEVRPDLSDRMVKEAGCGLSWTY